MKQYKIDNENVYLSQTDPTTDPQFRGKSVQLVGPAFCLPANKSGVFSHEILVYQIPKTNPANSQQQYSYAYVVEPYHPAASPDPAYNVQSSGKIVDRLGWVSSTYRSDMAQAVYRLTRKTAEGSSEEALTTHLPDYGITMHSGPSRPPPILSFHINGKDGWEYAGMFGYIQKNVDCGPGK